MDMLGRSMLGTLGFLGEIGKEIEEKHNRGTIIYTKNNCAQCRFTKLHMANMGVTYEERNVDEDDAYMQEALDTGYKSMPIVVLNGEVIASGFQPDKLDELKL